LLINACGNDSATQDPQQQAAPVTGNPAIDNLTQKIIDTPNDPTLYAARAGIFYEMEGYDEAIADLAVAIKMDSTNIEYHHVLADVYLDYYKSDLALKTMERAIALQPERIPTLLKMSEFQFILEQHTPSLKTVDQILRINPQESEAYYMMGRNFREMGDAERAIASFHTAVGYDSDLLEAWIYLGELFDKKDSKKAEQYFNNALEIDSTHIDALEGLGNHYHQDGKLDKAIKMYRKLNRMHPQHANAYYKAGLAYLELDSVDTAYQQFDLSVKMEPTLVMGYFYRGAVNEIKGNKTAAKSDYQQALNLSPDFERAQRAINNLK